MPLFDLQAQSEFAEDRPRSQLLYDSEAARVVLFNLRAGQTVPPHSAPVRVMMLVVAGQGQFRTGEDTFRVRPGYLAICEPNQPHGFSAEEDLTVLATIAPRPG